MNRRQLLASIAVAGLPSLSSCSAQYEQFLREREYPNVEAEVLQDAVDFVSESPNEQIDIADARTKDNGTVSIQENIIHPTFNPQILIVQPNTPVQWLNRVQPDENKEYGKIHTVIGVSDTSINSEGIKVDESFEYTFTEQRLFTYKCEIHDNVNMTGAVIVSDSTPE